MIEGFDGKVVKFCDEQHYTRNEPITEEEFSAVAFRLYGAFFTNSLSLFEIVTISNCCLLARLRHEK